MSTDPTKAKPAAGQSWLKKIPTYLLKIVAVLLILGIPIGIFFVLRLIIPPLLAGIVKLCSTSNDLQIVILLIYRALLGVCRIMTFPGSLWLWRRNIENHYQRAFVSKLKRKTIALRSLCDYLLEGRTWSSFCTADDLEDMKKGITSIVAVFERQKAHQTLKSKQLEMLNIYNEIETLFHETKVITKSDQRPFEFWDFLEQNKNNLADLNASKRDEIYRESKTIIMFAERSKGLLLSAKLKELEARLSDMVAQVGLFKRAKRFLFLNIFGTIDHVNLQKFAQYLDERRSGPTIQDQENKAKRIRLRLHRLFSLYVFGRIDDQIQSEDEKNKSDSSSDLLDDEKDLNANPTIIMCCPNAAYYEYMAWEVSVLLDYSTSQHEWVEFYLKNNLNVMLWNYRGYGMSTGNPTPDRNRKDGEAIVEYLRKKIGVKKIGVHGESVGGLVATHLAKAKNLDFLCADRTFMSLSRVGEVTISKKLSKLYRLLTLWNDNITNDYMDASCYKVMTFDPKDEIIHLLGSLKYGVTRKIAERRMGFVNEPAPPPIQEYSFAFSPLKIIGFFRSLIYYFRRECYEGSVASSLKKYNSILSDEQFQALFHAFDRVGKTIPFLNFIIKHGNFRKLANYEKDDSNDSSVKGPKIGIPSFLPSKGLSPSVEMTKTSTRNTDETVIFVNEDTLPAFTEVKGTAHLDSEYLLKSTKKSSYEKYLDEETKSTDSVIKFFEQVYAAMEGLEGGGIYLFDALTIKDEYKQSAFKHFLMNFEIWGSYYPLDQAIRDQAKNLLYYKEKANVKLKRFIKKLDAIIQSYRQSRTGIRIILEVLDDLELISAIMPYFCQRLNMKGIKYEEGDFNSPLPEESLKTQRSLDTKLIQVQDIEDGGSILINSLSLGHVIPVTCGHNGTLRQNEIDLYQYHIVTSKIAHPQQFLFIAYYFSQ